MGKNDQLNDEVDLTDHPKYCSFCGTELKILRIRKYVYLVCPKRYGWVSTNTDHSMIFISTYTIPINYDAITGERLV